MPVVRLALSVLRETYAVCRLGKDDPVPKWALTGPFRSITRDEKELSIVCFQTAVPEEIIAERDWRCLAVDGPLGFSLVGILVSLLSPLADVGIGIFVVSTYDTDFLFVKERDLEIAIHALSNAGHLISWKEKSEAESSFQV